MFKFFVSYDLISIKKNEQREHSQLAKLAKVCSFLIMFAKLASKKAYMRSNSRTLLISIDEYISAMNLKYKTPAG